jgi:hypothetical protein
MASVKLARLLAEPTRLRLFSAVALGATTPAEAARAAGVSARSTATGLRRLVDGGLIEESVDGLRVCENAIRETVRDEQPTAPADAFGSGDDDTDALLRTFIRDGKLVRLPSQFRRRQAVLRYLAERDFRHGVRYSERAVNDILRAWLAGSSSDHVSARRYLVDYGILDREDVGIYWLADRKHPARLVLGG